MCSLTTNGHRNGLQTLVFLKDLSKWSFINEVCQIASMSLSFLDKINTWQTYTKKISSANDNLLTRMTS